MVLRIKASSDAFFYAQTMPKLDFVGSFGVSAMSFGKNQLMPASPADGNKNLSAILGSGRRNKQIDRGDIW